MNETPSPEAPSFAVFEAAHGTKIAYHRLAGRDAGAPGLIFLGGFMSDMEGTKALALETYARERGLAYLRFDYQGHGVSSGRFEDGTIGLWAEDAIAAIDHLTEGPQIVVGSSMGGWIALLLALARPERVSALVGIAAAPDFTEVMWRDFEPEARKAIEETGVWELPSDYSDEPYLITRALIEDGRERCLLSGPIPLRCPVRLLQGIEDTAVPWRTALKVMESLESEDVEVILIKSGDHRLSGDRDLARLFGLLDDLADLTTSRASHSPAS